jgi:hypothetical protein
MKHGSGQGDKESVLDCHDAHPLPIKGGETCDVESETDYRLAGSPPLFILSPNGKSKR